MDILYLPLQMQHLFCQLWYLAQSLLLYLILSLIFSYLNSNHPYFILNTFDVHLCCPQNALLYI